VSGRILVIDDEKNITLVVDAILKKQGFSPLLFNEAAPAIEAIKSNKVDVVLTDLYLSEMGGMEVLAFCQKWDSRLPVVIMTAYGTVEAAVSALKKGAFDFITKPFDQTELTNIISKALRTRNEQQKEPTSNVFNNKEIPESSMVGKSKAMQDVIRLISKVADSPSTVLILGESGTGKELVAFEVHRKSKRLNKPFIKVNCGAIPSTLIESELFGYEKGAFTGAVTAKPGRFELANQGTIFLDEIGDMPLEMQVKLLRVIQEHEFERVGGVRTIKVDVRIIAATNKNIEDEVKNGRFREDLYYRLNVVPIVLPPLRERKEDVEILAQMFYETFKIKLNKKIEGIRQEVMEKLIKHPWPGNIRQLENVIERMVLMSENVELCVDDLPAGFLDDINKSINPSSAPASPADTSDSSGNLKDIVKQKTQVLERGLIEKALDETNGNVTRAAEKLGLSRKGLQLKIKELGVRPVEYKA